MTLSFLPLMKSSPKSHSEVQVKPWPTLHFTKLGQREREGNSPYRPGIPREISGDEGYPRGSPRQVHKELRTRSSARGRRARCFCARDPGRSGKRDRRDLEAGAAEGGRSCPTRQPAPASRDHPAALPEASLAAPRPQRARRLHRAGWHLGTPAPAGRERRRGDRGALRAPARDAPPPPPGGHGPRVPPGARTSDVGALALVQLAGGRGAHGGGARVLLGGDGRARSAGGTDGCGARLLAPRSWRLMRWAPGLCS